MNPILDKRKNDIKRVLQSHGVVVRSVRIDELYDKIDYVAVHQKLLNCRCHDEQVDKVYSELEDQLSRIGIIPSHKNFVVRENYSQLV